MDASTLSLVILLDIQIFFLLRALIFGSFHVQRGRDGGVGDAVRLAVRLHVVDASVMDASVMVATISLVVLLDPQIFFLLRALIFASIHVQRGRDGGVGDAGRLAVRLHVVDASTLSLVVLLDPQIFFFL